MSTQPTPENRPTPLGQPMPAEPTGADATATAPVPPAQPSPSAQPDPSIQPAQPDPPTLPDPLPRGPRIGTVVWGVLVILAAAYLVMAVLGRRVDVQLAAIVALAATGVALLLAAIVSAVRRR
ncbi:MAG: hypothetical protein BGO96_12905 [Micrococcales bacterium 73-15]|uniref:hypothetical protein n=1 Tax=Salana multivorans TaxID=120377 RepID=UPI000968538E|nr:hypothetical protein [Salana multivorans]OJX97822.1 MAG: hypothetical protein BGO96_12905 [Micrococcales bacterium 73-15]